MFTEVFTFFIGWGLLMWLIICLRFSKKKKISGSTVLITGAAQGLGQQMAIDFAKAGCKIIGWDLKSCQDTANKVKAATGQEMEFSEVDVTSYERIQELGKKIDANGGVDILINNAGIVGAKSLLESEPKFIRLLYDVNVMSIFWTVKTFLPGMNERGKGHIVNIGSMAGYAGNPKMVPYAGSKAAVQRLDATLRYELMASGSPVKTTQVNPYYISTGMFDGAKGFLWYGHSTPEYVSSEIIKGVQYEYEELCLPKSMAPLTWLPYIVPTFVCDFVASVLIFKGLDEFKGHKEKGGADK